MNFIRMKGSCQTCYRRGIGNDTIDPYPLFPGETKKILIIKKDIFEELSSRYHVFCKSLVGHQAKQPLHPEPITKHFTKNKLLKDKERQWSTYEPSGKEHTNDYNWRRWVRVKEWFNEFNPDTEKFERTVLMQ